MARITQEHLVELAACTGAALEKGDEYRKAYQAQQEKVAAAIPEVTRSLLKAGTIEARETEDLARVLRDPVQTLELLTKVAAHGAQREAEALQAVKEASASAPVNTNMGRPHDDAQPGVIKSSNFIGRRGGARASDQAWYQATLGHNG
jgi:flagellar hook-length control protein FliK